MRHDITACFAALADPTRRAVVEQLTRGPATVSTLAAPHNMALPTFMRHLSVLEKCALIRSEKTGRVRTCILDPQALFETQAWLAWQRETWEREQDRRDQLSMPLD